jgi:outer membrane protein OmpA-like peptidoglycan-associated protein
MRTYSAPLNPFASKLATLLFVSAFAAPALAQDPQPAANPQANPPALQDQSAPTSTPPPPPAASQVPPPKEGFWGHLNPFATKKYVKKSTDPINDQLNELDEVNGRNAKDIKDVDQRAQSGIHQAQSAADAADQTATAAGNQAQQANSTAQVASNHVDQLKTTVNGLDQYRPVNEVDVTFRGSQPVLSAEARKQLDDFAANVSGRQGYILEVEAHSPIAGSAGIQSSERLAEAVQRYLVTEHDIPVYRMHAVALGNALEASNDESSEPIRHSSVHIQLMENSLATDGAAGSTPQGAASVTNSATGTAQP